MKSFLQRHRLFLLRFAGGMLTFCALQISLRGDDAPVEGQPPEVAFTNAPPKAVFTSVEDRDPFSPVGYKKPKPKEKQEVTVKPVLQISGISFIDGKAVATLKSGLVLEEGETYLYTSPDGKATASYRVVSINEDTVTIECNEEEISFSIGSLDFEQFKEKE